MGKNTSEGLQISMCNPNNFFHNQQTYMFCVFKITVLTRCSVEQRLNATILLSTVGTQKNRLIQTVLLSTKPKHMLKHPNFHMLKMAYSVTLALLLLGGSNIEAM